ncbi:MAG: hypothetical protein QXG00_06085 [Candidatus Woesearchaeota archaeon]
MQKQMLTKQEVSEQFQQKLNYSNILCYLLNDLFRFMQIDSSLNDTKDCDIEIITETNSLLRIEVKQEKKSKYTGNIAIEYESWGKPSGVATTKANLWVHFFLDPHDVWNFVIFDVRKFRTEIETIADFKTAGGDNNRSLMYILNVEKIRRMKSVIVFGCVPTLSNILGT